MPKYNHNEIESKWRSKWEADRRFHADDDSDKEKFYVLDMFPYPSGAGLHVGHPMGYIGTDIIAKFQMMHRKNVLHPMGWDAFGLPAENYAIKTGTPPQQSTEQNIATYKRQIKSIGLGYDWDREINTSDPEYYKWTQWFFLLLYKNKLAYRKEAPVNWCESCKTVLANEQVINGRCDRCKTEVIQRKLKQWFFKITNFADRLDADLDKIDWPQNLKTIQRNWIGRSIGAQVTFEIGDTDELLEVFTTRPDTLFGATYMVVAPEHPIIEKLADRIDNMKEVAEYQKDVASKSELERTDLNKTKSGVQLHGIKAINPLNKEEIPIFISDYVLITYGTGAIMAVPAHDQRDYEFAQKFNLPIRQVIGGGSIDEAAHEGDGALINSGFLDGLEVEAAKRKVIDHLESAGIGYGKTQYRLRDWLVSRQRYWGAPIPIIHCENCGEVPVPEDELPVKLPTDVDFRPTGESPLVYSETFHDITCPKCAAPARRESDTMDTFVCSSWYYFRYADPKNEKKFAAKEKLERWLPVDLYVGGVEHAVLHLMYARFFTKVLHDTGHITFDEPFAKLRNQGLILGEDGEKMSKSRGNVINPDAMIEEYGADTLRVYEMFMGPFEEAKPWDTKGVLGVRRFLEKISVNADRLSEDKTESWDDLVTLTHQTIKKVTEDIETLQFNTAISALMILNNKFSEEAPSKDLFVFLIKLLAPFAPHLAEELWERFGDGGSIFEQEWPKYDPEKTVASVIEIPVQVNSKIRARIFVAPDTAKEEVETLARAEENVQKHLEGKEIKKVVHIPNKIINFIV